MKPEAETPCWLPHQHVGCSVLSTFVLFRFSFCPQGFLRLHAVQCDCAKTCSSQSSLPNLSSVDAPTITSVQTANMMILGLPEISLSYPGPWHQCTRTFLSAFFFELKEWKSAKLSACVVMPVYK